MTEPPQGGDEALRGAPDEPPAQAYDRPVPAPPGPSPYGPPAGHGPPQYPFPGQPYAPAPPKRKRRTPLIVGLVALVALVVTGVALAFTLGPTVLSRSATERDVAAQFQDLEGVAVDLTCPSRMTVDEGAQYTCTGTTAKGEHVKLSIRIERAGSRPTYTWTEP